MKKINVEYIAIDCITPYARNAKKHPMSQVEHIANSIREFGFKQPIVIDEHNVVVIGHGRLLAAKELQMSEVPCIRAEGLTQQQINALRLADNKTNESEWELGLLDVELDDITDMDMGLFGFDSLSTQAQESCEALDLDDVTASDKQKITCHCPKCGFIFEVNN